MQDGALEKGVDGNMRSPRLLGRKSHLLRVSRTLVDASHDNFVSSSSIEILPP